MIQITENSQQLDSFLADLRHQLWKYRYFLQVKDELHPGPHQFYADFTKMSS